MKPLNAKLSSNHANASLSATEVEHKLFAGMMTKALVSLKLNISAPRQRWSLGEYRQTLLQSEKS